VRPTNTKVQWTIDTSIMLYSVEKILAINEQLPPPFIQLLLPSFHKVQYLLSFTGMKVAVPTILLTLLWAAPTQAGTCTKVGATYRCGWSFLHRTTFCRQIVPICWGNNRPCRERLFPHYLIHHGPKLFHSATLV
jgi:hypothetical protein